MGDVAVEHGTGGVTVARVCHRAGVSRATFYQQFVSAEDGLACATEAAYEDLWALLEQRAGGAALAARDPGAAVAALVVAFLDVMAQRPAIGRLCVVQPPTAMPRALRARRQLIERLVAFLDGVPCAIDDQRLAQAAIGAVGALSELVQHRAAERGGVTGGKLDGLAVPAVTLVLAPYVGRARAQRHARVAARRRISERRAPVPPALTHLARCTLLHLRDHPHASNDEVAAAIGVRHQSQISRHLHRLARERLIVHARAGRRNAWSLSDHGRRAIEAAQPGR
ncbi:MAG TPA: TetR family transcriptional regulator [Baekduia sp.]|uniref:TetR family transcriptional regulator n=1 Tax=Baekduia sp. TaxID=2600305 RepID=UPI002D77F5C7|nr:TetR family transcriptional regulator [Baekduia sp.]HET6509558.1 TetR family transcriptional regulator [Baekduia sp.]